MSLLEDIQADMSGSAATSGDEMDDYLKRRADRLAGIEKGEAAPTPSKREGLMSGRVVKKAAKSAGQGFADMFRANTAYNEQRNADEEAMAEGTRGYQYEQPQPKDFYGQNLSGEQMQSAMMKHREDWVMDKMDADAGFSEHPRVRQAMGVFEQKHGRKPTNRELYPLRVGVIKDDIIKKTVYSREMADLFPKMTKADEYSSGRVEDAIVGISRFFPSMAATAVAPPAGLIATHHQLLGSYYEEARNKNIDKDTAFQGSFLKATMATPVEFAGNVLQIKGAIKAFKAVGGSMKLNKKMTEVFMGMMQGSLGEGIEEYTQKHTDVIGDVYMEDPEVSVEDMMTKVWATWASPKFQKEARDEGYTGAVGGLLIPGFGGAISTVGEMKTFIGRKLEEHRKMKGNNELQDKIGAYLRGEIELDAVEEAVKEKTDLTKDVEEVEEATKVEPNKSIDQVIAEHRAEKGIDLFEEEEKKDAPKKEKKPKKDKAKKPKEQPVVEEPVAPEPEVAPEEEVADFTTNKQEARDYGASIEGNEDAIQSLKDRQAALQDAVDALNKAGKHQEAMDLAAQPDAMGEAIRAAEGNLEEVMTEHEKTRLEDKATMTDEAREQAAEKKRLIESEVAQELDAPVEQKQLSIEDLIAQQLAEEEGDADLEVDEQALADQKQLEELMTGATPQGLADLTAAFGVDEEISSPPKTTLPEETPSPTQLRDDILEDMAEAEGVDLDTLKKKYGALVEEEEQEPEAPSIDITYEDMVQPVFIGTGKDKGKVIKGKKHEPVTGRGEGGHNKAKREAIRTSMMELNKRTEKMEGYVGYPNAKGEVFSLKEIRASKLGTKKQLEEPEGPGGKWRGTKGPVIKEMQRKEKQDKVAEAKLVKKIKAAGDFTQEQTDQLIELFKGKARYAAWGQAKSMRREGDFGDIRDSIMEEAMDYIRKGGDPAKFSAKNSALKAAKSTGTKALVYNRTHDSGYP